MSMVYPQTTLGRWRKKVDQSECGGCQEEVLEDFHNTRIVNILSVRAGEVQ